MSLGNLQKELEKMAKNLKDGKKAKEFMRKSGTKLRNKTIKIAKSKVGEKTGNYIKSIKRGKVYEFDNALAVRSYSYAPHAHLIEKGHVIKDRTGGEHGFKKGHHIFETAENEFRDEFYDGADKFIEEILKESGF